MQQYIVLHEHRHGVSVHPFQSKKSEKDLNSTGEFERLISAAEKTGLARAELVSPLTLPSQMPADTVQRQSRSVIDPSVSLGSHILTPSDGLLLVAIYCALSDSALLTGIDCSFVQTVISVTAAYVDAHIVATFAQT